MVSRYNDMSNFSLHFTLVMRFLSLDSFWFLFYFPVQLSYMFSPNNTVQTRFFWLTLFCFKIEIEDDGDESDGSDSESNEVLDLSKVTEMRLVPSDPSQCIYKSFF